jgi:hypothetical protein
MDIQINSLDLEMRWGGMARKPKQLWGGSTDQNSIYK